MKYSKLTYSKSILQRVLSIALMSAPSVIGLSALLLPLIVGSPAQAAPLPKDWCGRIWEVQTTTGNNAVIGWVNPNPGTTQGNSVSSPPPNVAAIPSLPSGGSFAALGIHTQSGTLYTFDRATSTLYRYSMSAGGTTWATTSLTSQIATNSSLNFNKMTVIGDNLILASANSLNTFSFAITPTTGALGGGTSVPYTWAMTNNATFGANPAGIPPGTRQISSGDIAQDEYGGVYNIVYDGGNATITADPQYAYFYKLVSTTWQYRGRAQKANIGDQFAGLAVYNDTFYAKGTNSVLYQVPLIYTGTDANGEYNWTNNLTLTPVGSGGVGSTDLASCGIPAISVNKTQSVYTDPAGTSLATDQTRIGTGQYIKYTIIVSNQGDAWSKGTTLTDALPVGVTYVANSAYRNGISMNAATYPFGTPLAIKSDSALDGEVKLAPFSSTNKITYTFIVRVDGTAPSVANKAIVKYTGPTPSLPEVCPDAGTASVEGTNCGVSALGTQYPSIFGTVWNDANSSASNAFTNIFTTGEVGTNTKIVPTDPSPLYALLVKTVGSNVTVVASSPIANNGTYSFAAIDTNQSNLQILLSTTPGTVNSAPPVAAVPTDWKATSPNTRTGVNVSTADILNQDFGIRLPTKTIIVKRITGIKPAGGILNNTINPNDSTSLNPVTPVHNPADALNNDINPNWPANYLKGTFNAGKIKPGDEIEYTIYYLNAKGADATNLKICDPIRGNQSYAPNTMQLQPGSSTTPITLTDLDDTADRAYSYGLATPSGTPAVIAPNDCNTASATATGANQGGVAIGVTGTGTNPILNLPALTSATGPGTPATSYGWFRFRTKVNP